METKNIKIISIDVANKSLAIACFTVSLSSCNERLTVCADIPNSISIKSLMVCDLIPGKKVSDTSLIERTNSLCIFLIEFTDQLIEDKWLEKKATSAVHLIIEYQMGPNRKSGDVQSQIIYHFLQYLPPNNIHIVGPSLKNKLKLFNDPLSHHNHYIEKYQTLYAANKAHTRYLFLSWLKNNKQLNALQQIKKKNYADISDAFCQAIAWYQFTAQTSLIC